ncbi:MAG: hypothetical protein LUH14_10500 [Clostridiaceae bacterium]|nr:hypothetical protein [Clostridiaceae bacterium]
MNDKLNLMITDMENRIKWEQENIDKYMVQIKEDIDSYDEYRLVTFVPGMIARINEAQNRRAQYSEQLKMLQFLQKEN